MPEKYLNVQTQIHENARWGGFSVYLNHFDSFITQGKSHPGDGQNILM